MTELLIALACCAVYYGLGLWLVARPRVTREVAHKIMQRPVSARQPGQIDEWRRESAVFAAVFALVWPALWVVDHLAESAPRSAPETELLLEQRAKRIAELEREAEAARVR